MDSLDYGKRLFTFAVIADSHLNKDECDCNSPFPVNKLANMRLRHVIRDINSKHVRFVVHLGDLIHPVPAVKELYSHAAERFKEQVTELIPPIHLTPGNHDIGDKPMPWAPAGIITTEYIQLWKKTFGADYYSFDHQGIHFVIINSQLFNSGFKEEREQKDWLEKDLKENKKKRIFVFTHYPPFLYQKDEAEHYDNIADPERAWLLDLLASHGVEGLFAGHVHNFWYQKDGDCRHYLLPSTAFVRQDYSEMFQAPPDLKNTEAGRDDAAKLGYFLVHVHERGHVCEMVRTRGALVAADSPASEPVDFVGAVPPALNRVPVLGFDLRNGWGRGVDIPPSGALDEFDRKRVRNDYTLLALWEMGVRRLRIPFQDLRDAETVQRMQDLLTLGHQFTLYSYGLPGPADEELLEKNAHLLAAWEIGFHEQGLGQLAAGLGRLRRKTGVPVLLDRLWEHQENRTPDGRYYHVMNHGFTPKDAALITKIREHPELAGVGFVFRAMRDDDLGALTAFASHTAAGLPASLHLRLTGINPAEVVQDDDWLAGRVAEAMFYGLGAGLTVFADTLIDSDRGYFVHHGVLDRTCNPRRGAKVIGTLHAALNMGHGELAPVQKGGTQGDWLWMRQGKEMIALYRGDEDASGAPLALPEEIFSAPADVTAINLDDGHMLSAASVSAGPGALYFLRGRPAAA